MTISNLYTLYRRAMKSNPEYDFHRCRYEFGGGVVTRITKRYGQYYIHTTHCTVIDNGNGKVR